MIFLWRRSRTILWANQVRAWSWTIIRTRKIEPQKTTIVRDVVTLPAVQEQLTADNVGIIKAQVLTKGSANEIAEKIKSLQKKGAKKTGAGSALQL